VAFETLRAMDTRLKGREGFMAMKLDMSRARPMIGLSGTFWKR
jgi:hypothetical protein